VLSIVAGIVLCLTAANTASACPMCKLANESDSRLPRAYMYSILFMLGMPATVLSGFSIGFWRLSRQAARLHLEAAEQPVLGAPDPAVEAIQAAEQGSTPPPEPSRGIPGTGFAFP
jgi:hypothetical protein